MQTPDTLKYCTAEEGALLKAGVQHHRCNGSIEQAKAMSLPGWEMAEAYYKQFIRAISEECPGFDMREWRDRDGYHYVPCVEIQEVMKWPSLDNQYSQFSINVGEEVEEKTREGFEKVIAYMAEIIRRLDRREPLPGNFDQTLVDEEGFMVPPKRHLTHQGGEKEGRINGLALMHCIQEVIRKGILMKSLERYEHCTRQKSEVSQRDPLS